MSNFILKNKYNFSRNEFCKEKENFAFWEMRGTFLLTERGVKLKLHMMETWKLYRERSKSSKL